MTQTLYLLRHAEAESWNPLGNDFSRALSSSGEQHAALVSNWAFETLSRPDTVICSPAKRTRETLAPLLAKWPRLLATTDYIDSMYNASLNMLQTLAEDAFTYSETLLMVGHNPGIAAMLTSTVQAEQASGLVSMRPGTLAVIEFSGKFDRNRRVGNLSHLVLKKHLSVN